MSTITQDISKGNARWSPGATSGIGRAVALQLARDGAEVLVHGRDAARGAKTVAEITASGGKASFVAADLGDAADVQRLASDVGDVDILINNAGIAPSARPRSSTSPRSTRCSPATSGRRSSSSRRSLPGWPRGATAASSASAAWPAASVSSAARPTARRKRRSRR